MRFKSGFVTIIGRPNVGKSTLLNKLTGEKVAITSNRPQTTRNTIKTIVTDEDSQIVFIDTPGIHKPQNKLGEYMVNAANEAFNNVDVVLFLVDAEDKKPGLGDKYIIERFKRSKTPVFLVINKIDLVSKELLLSAIDMYNQEYGFKATIPISAKNNDGIDILHKEIKNILPKGPKYFEDDMLTDQPEKHIVSEIVREKILRLIQDEIPHGVGVEVTKFKERTDKDILDIDINIYCEKDTHKGIIIGKHGSMLKKIGTLAREDVEKFLDTKVFMQLWVKVKPDWRNSDYMLKNLGYK